MPYESWFVTDDINQNHRSLHDANMWSKVKKENNQHTLSHNFRLIKTQTLFQNHKLIHYWISLINLSFHSKYLAMWSYNFNKTEWVRIKEQFALSYKKYCRCLTFYRINQMQLVLSAWLVIMHIILCRGKPLALCCLSHDSTFPRLVPRRWCVDFMGHHVWLFSWLINPIV